MPRRLAVLLAATLALSSAGCSALSWTAEESSVVYTTELQIEEPTISSAVPDRTEANDWYQSLVAEISENVYQPARMRPSRPLDVADFNSVAVLMVPDVANQWNTVVEEALTGDEGRVHLVRGLAMFNLHDEGYTLEDSVRYAVNEKITDATITATLPAGYAVRFTYSAHVRALHSDVRLLVPFRSSYTFELVPSARYAGWSIQSWTTEWTADGSAAVQE